MDLRGLVGSLLPILGQAGVDALTVEVNDLTTGADEPWKKAVLGLIANGVEAFGLQGVQVATQTLAELMDGGDPDITWVDLDVASNVLAHMQNAEADHKLAAHEFLSKVGKVLGQVFEGIIKGLIAAA